MSSRRSYITQAFFILVGLVFVLNLFHLQVIDDKYKLKAKDNTVRKIDVYPYRGIITDRYKRPVVVNKASFDLMVVKRKVQNLDTAALCDLLGITKDYVKKELDNITGLARNKPQAFLKLVSQEQYASIEDKFDFQGFYFAPRIVRAYPTAVMANSLGYIAEINQKELDRDTIDKYKSGDYVGKRGIEKTYEPDLHGARGAKYVLVNVKGVENGIFNDGDFDEPSVPGDNLQLSIDAELQAYGEQLMKGKVGSIVAIEPKTGEILAIVSSPTYDPNLLTGANYSKNYGVLVKDSLRPLYDRATQAGYPPGSIFKIIQSLILLQDGVVTPTSTVYVDHSLVGDHAPPGYYNVKKAIQYSSNNYYYKMYGKMLYKKQFDNRFEDAQAGYRRWREQVLSFGLGQRLGSDISHEKGGQIPTNAFYDRWYPREKGSWKESTIRSNSIGQGELLVVPIQMANLAALIANKGWFYTPHLIKGIGDTDSIPEKFKQKHYCVADERHFPVIHDAMQLVVENGTAGRAITKDITVCGKTGTAQNPHGEDHSCFIAFAPKENPQIAISVYVENAGYGGTWAAPIASLMIEKFIKGEITNKYKEKRILEKSFTN